MEAAERRGSQQPDLTRQAVTRYLTALDAEKYEVSVLFERGTPSQRMKRASMTTDEILADLAFFKRENARGADIFIRPDDTRYVLVDDLNRDNISKMKRDGLNPSALLETSPDNYQAWIKLADEPMEKDVAGRTGRMLAERYQADLNSADWRHLGRMPGFTNRKPKHEREGRYPYVLIHEYKPRLARGGPMLADKADQQERIERIERARKGDTTVFEANHRINKGDYLRTVSNMKELPSKKDGSPDWSRVDYRVARDLGRGGYYPNFIKKEIMKHSPNLRGRKGPNAAAYAERTVSKALDSLSPLMNLMKQDGDFEKRKEHDRDDLAR